MSFARIKTALMQETGKVIKYGVVGGGIGGAFVGMIGYGVQNTLDFLGHCSLAHDMGAAYGCTAKLKQITRKIIECSISCDPVSNRDPFIQDVDSKFQSKSFVVLGYTAAIGFTVGFVIGASYGVYDVINSGNEMLEESLLDEQYYVDPEEITVTPVNTPEIVRQSQSGMFASRSAVELTNIVDIEANQNTASNRAR